MTVRILLASSANEVMDRLATVVEEVVDFTLAGRATSSNSVPHLLRRGDIDVLVIDEGLGPMMALDVVRDVVARFPFVAVVVVSGDDTISSLRAAVDAGARGVVTLRMSFEEIAAQLRVVSTWAASIRALVDAERSGAGDVATGSLVAVNGSKGGVGVTTIAVRMALDAAAAGRSVCLLDMDLQAGDVGHALDVSHHRDITDLIGIVDETGMAIDDALYAHVSGLRVLLAPADGERGEDVDGASARAVLSRLRSVFDLVIVDCGAVVTESSAVALAMAEHAVIVATPDVLSLRAARRLSQLWARLEIRSPGDCSVLLNRVSKGSEVQPRTAVRITGLPHLAATVPAAFRKLEESVNTAASVHVQDKRLARAYAELSKELGLSVGRSPAALDAPTPDRGNRARRGRAAYAMESGSASVELVAMLPLALLVIALLLQGSMLGFTYVLAGEAANRASRTLAVGGSAEQAGEAARAVLPGAWANEAVGVSVPVTASGALNPDAEVTVTLPVPLLGLGRPLPLDASASAAWGRG